MLALLFLWLGASGYQIAGRVVPPSEASVRLDGVAAPFAASTLSDAGGSFRFHRIEAGPYTVAVFVPGRGETHKTIDVGPRTADAKGNVDVTVKLDDSTLTPDQRSLISVRELSISGRARKEYEEAQKKLSKRDVAGCVAHLQRATAISPQFTAAWNQLGTIAYEQRNYKTAERDFRQALLADPNAYAPLVNLGGVLMNLGDYQQAWEYNFHAVLKRPNDALANAQLGIACFSLRKMDPAEKYLLQAEKLDPGHFSHPQLFLAQIYLRRRDFNRAAAQLEDFLKYHPDWLPAAELKKKIQELREMR